MKVNDRVRLKKKHPCGGELFEIVRVGSDVKLRCETCGSFVTLSRQDAERRIRETLDGTRL